MSDYFSVLAQRIEEIQNNPAESRWVIYELARSTLRKQIYLSYPPPTREQVREQMEALEGAIARIEAVALQQDDRPRLSHQPSDAGKSEPPVDPAANVAEPEQVDMVDSWDEGGSSPGRGELVLPPARLDQGAPFTPVPTGYYHPPTNIPTFDFTRPPYEPREPHVTPRKRIFSMLGGTLQITIASVAAVAIYAGISGRQVESVKASNPATDRAPTEPALPFAERLPAAIAGAPAPGAASAPRSPAYLLPAMYGVYAIANHQLIALDQVATGPVDPRTRTTLQISKPSRTILADGRLTFILYRRDLLTSAPDKVPIRIAAKIARTMNFDSNGKAVVATPPNDIWLIRDIGYDLRVLPVRESQEMIFVRAEEEDFSFPPGRYVLMFNGQPYDFTVEGPLTSPRHCVEGFATVRGPAFNECRPQSG